MSFLASLVLIWALIGLASAIWMTLKSWYEGIDITYSDLVDAFLVFLSGPVTPIAVILTMVSETINDKTGFYNKVAIKGRGSSSSS